MRAIVRTVHDILVGPFKIESINQRFAHAPVFELVAPRVDEPALCAGRRIVRQHGALDATVLKSREIITCGPSARREFLTEEIILRRESFEPDLPIAVILESNSVKVILSTRNRKISSPPGLHAFKFDEMPDLEAPDLIGAAAKRNIEGRFIERFFRIVGARKNR